VRNYVARLDLLAVAAAASDERAGGVEG